MILLLFLDSVLVRLRIGCNFWPPNSEVGSLLTGCTMVFASGGEDTDREDCGGVPSLCGPLAGPKSNDITGTSTIQNFMSHKVVSPNTSQRLKWGPIPLVK